MTGFALTPALGSKRNGRKFTITLSWVRVPELQNRQWAISN